MDLSNYYKRDAYGLQYNRSSAQRLPYPLEYVEPRLNDTQLLRYSNLEKQAEESLSDWNSSLNEQSQELRAILDETRFLFQRLKDLNPSSILNTTPPVFWPLGFEPRRDATNELTFLYKRKKVAESHRDEIRQKLESFLKEKSQTFRGVKGDRGDTLLYRVQVHPYSCSWSPQPHKNAHSPSGTKKNPLGYRCSGWDSFSLITNEDIMNHMNKVMVGTPLISVSESPHRLRKILDQTRDEHATVIEVFSLQMLAHIGVLQARSTDLCDMRGIPRKNGEDVPGAARWTTDTHRVVLHWIPDEALVATMTPQEFRAVESRAMAKNQHVTKADFPKVSFAPVKTPIPIQTSDYALDLPGQFKSLGLASGNTTQEAIDLTITSETQIQPAEKATAPTASSNAAHASSELTSSLTSRPDRIDKISSCSVPDPQPTSVLVTEPSPKSATSLQSKATNAAPKLAPTETSKSLQSSPPSQMTQPSNITKPKPPKSPPSEPPSRATQSTKPVPMQSFFNSRYPIPDEAPISPVSAQIIPSQATSVPPISSRDASTKPTWPSQQTSGTRVDPPPAMSAFGQSSTTKPVFGTAKETPHSTSVVGEPSTIPPAKSSTRSVFGEASRPATSGPGQTPVTPLQSNAKSAFTMKPSFSGYRDSHSASAFGESSSIPVDKLTPAPAFSFATVVPLAADREPLFGEATTAAPATSSRPFGGFQPTPNFNFSSNTGSATTGASSPFTGDRKPFDQPNPWANAPAASSGGLFTGFQPNPAPFSFLNPTTTATSSGGLFSGFQPDPPPSFSFATGTKTASTGRGLFGQAPPAGGHGGLFGQAPTEKNAPAASTGGFFGQAQNASGGEIFGQGTMGTNPAAGGGERLFGQARTEANIPVNAKGGLFGHPETVKNYPVPLGAASSNLGGETEGEKPDSTCNQQ